jgi:hypothetical protein
MPLMLVTCPESTHLEQIEYDQHPLGMLIRACSRFEVCRLDCPRTCAARLDRREPAIDVLRIGDDTDPEIHLDCRSLFRAT